MKTTNTQKICYSAIFIALCIVLPFLTGQLKSLGNALCPMHFPVLLCGYICGYKYGAAVGFISPIFRSLLFSMPVLYPDALAMAFELATYGLIVGVLYKKFNKNYLHILFSLLISMVVGRLVWGFSSAVLVGFGESMITLSAFWTRAFVNAIPGIILQILLIPLIILVLQKTVYKKIN